MQDRSDHVVSAVLCGGGSRRFGSDKAEASVQGASLLDWALQYAQRGGGPCYLLAKKPPLRSLPPGVAYLRDCSPVSTPISGILSVTPRVKEWLLLLACDMILPAPELIDLLFRKREGRKAVFLGSGDELHPFPGLYHRSQLYRWEEAFHSRHYRLRPIIEAMPHIAVGRDILRREGFPDEPFININYPSDCRRAEDAAGF